LVLSGLISSAAFGSSIPSSSSISRPQFRIDRSASAIVVDGVLDEEAWKQALVVELGTEISPGINVPAPVATIALLTYDESHLYAAFRAHDPEPAAIRAHLTDRDAAYRDDFVGLMLDTFNDERRGFEFFVNPLGVQMDLSRSETGDEEEDASWDAIWRSAGRIHETGYTVEMAIPFASLRFQRAAGEQTWGVFPFRAYPRNVRHQLSPIPLDPDNSCFFCQVPKVTGFAGATPGRNLEIAPTLTAGRTDRQEAFPEGGLEAGSEETDLGLTARWGITPNLVLSGAVNPDFSQVEADAAQLDVNTQFALFYPEKRPFFQEGADFFGTPFSIIHTRTVADPAWGIKVTGKEGANGLGLFVAEDDVTSLLLPASQLSDSVLLPGGTTDAALRYRRDLGSTSHVGAVLTHREGSAGYVNSVYGVDGRYHPSPSDSITVQLLGSATEYPSELAAANGLQQGRFDGTALRVSYNHGTKNWYWYARYDDVSEDFRADLGFMPQVDFSFKLAGLERIWHPKDKSWYSNFSIGGDWDETKDQDGTLLEREVEAWANLSGPWQSFARLDVGRRDRFWNGVTFDEQFAHFYVEAKPTGALSVQLETSVADTIDFLHTRAGDLFVVEPSLTYDLGKHLSFGLSHSLQRVDVDEGLLIEANLSQLRTVYQVNMRTFVRAIFQYTDLARDPAVYTSPVDSEDRHLFTQLLFSYKVNPQTVLFLGYSDNQVGGDLTGFDQRIVLTRTDRTFFFKVGYALVL
jgi:hypothetical protein